MNGMYYQIVISIDIGHQASCNNHDCGAIRRRREVVHFDKARFIAVLSIPSSFSNRLFFWL